MVVHVRLALGVSLGLVLLAGAARADDPRSSLKSGKPDLEIGRSVGLWPPRHSLRRRPARAAIFAIDTGDTCCQSTGPLKVEGIGEKIAGAIGVDAKQMLITDMAVNPISGNAYLGVSRGRGPDAIPVIVKVDRSEKVEVMPLDNVKFAKTELSKAAKGETDRIHHPTRVHQGPPLHRRALQRRVLLEAAFHSLPVQRRRHRNRRRNLSRLARPVRDQVADSGRSRLRHQRRDELAGRLQMHAIGARSPLGS